MANFNITINSEITPSFYVEQKPVISSDCSSYYEYIVYATDLDDIDISLVGDHEFETYILNGVSTPFTDSVTGISYNTSLVVHFSIQNSGMPGIFPEATLTITNNTEADTYESYVQRLNDNVKCGANANFLIGADTGSDENVILGDLVNINGLGPLFTTVTKAATTIDVDIDLTFGTTAGTVAEGNDSRINNGQTAFSWGDHALAGYLTSFTETDPVFIASQAFNIDATDITNLSNLSGVNTGDQDLSPYMLLSQKGAAFGVAELDENGILLVSQMPSYVDDVLEFNTIGDLPTTGESGKIYITTDTNKTYRWGGSTYVPIGSDLALGETSSTAYRGDRGKVAYDHSQITNGNPHGTTFAQLNSKPTTISGYGITDFNSLGDARWSPIITGGASTIVSSNLTANRALLSDASGKVAVSTVTNTELGYVSGVTSAIQTQLNAKLETSSYTAVDVLAKLLTVDGSGSGLDADTLDGIQGEDYLRSNTSDSFTGSVLTFNDNTQVRFGDTSPAGSVGHLKMQADGSQMLFDMGASWTLRDAGGSSAIRFTFFRSTGAFTATGNVTANSFTKTGGTSSQFLKADGSVDTNSYALSSHTHTFSSLTSKPTTIGGYGITDFNSLGDARWFSQRIGYAGDINTISVSSHYGLTSGATNIPSGDVALGSSLIHYQWDANAAKQVFYSTTTNNSYWRIKNGGTWGAWQKYWTDTNDGSGSGLDADLLRGVHWGNVNTNIISSANIGVGITGAPSARLTTGQVSTPNYPTLGTPYGSVFFAGDSQQYGLYIGSNTSNGRVSIQAMRNNTPTAYDVLLNPVGGNVGIGTTNPSYKLDVSGTGRFTDTVTATNFILSSDERLKNDIKEVTPKAIKTDWKTFELKSEKGQKRYGVIAQELEKEHPEFVRTNDEGIKSVAYIDLLIAKITELEDRLKKAGI